MTGLRARILGGLGANAFGQLVTTFIQLISVPVFLHFWSVEQYGVWLLISAIPAYLSIGDLGLGTVAMNSMTILHAKGDIRGARTVFQTAVLMIAILLCALFAVSCFVIWLLPLDVLAADSARTTLSFLVVVALLNLSTSLVDGVFRASGEFGFGTFLINLARLVEWMGGIIGLLFVGTMLAVATGFLIARVASMIALHALAGRRFPEYPLGIAHATPVDMRQMLRPALSFLSFPLGNALVMQGMSVVVGTTFGPAALAMFNTYRTLSRVPVQLLATFSRALWPEISRSFGAGDLQVLRRMYRQGNVVSLLLCATACGFVLATGHALLELWTHGEIGFDLPLLAAFLAAAFANCAWQIGQVLLSATNQHERLASAYAVAAILGLTSAAMLPVDWGMQGKVLAQGAFEAFLVIYSHRLVARLLEDRCHS